MHQMHPLSIFQPDDAWYSYCKLVSSIVLSMTYPTTYRNMSHVFYISLYVASLGMNILPNGLKATDNRPRKDT